MDNEQISEQAAAYKADARRLFEDAVAALIALAYRYQHLGVNFLWDSDPVLDRECNAILRDLSDKAKEAAKRRAAEIIEEAGWDEDGLAGFDETDEDSILWSFDMAGSHLRELLEVWVALAFAEGMTPAYLKINVLRYLANPYASPQWSRLPSGLMKWGRGYQRDLINQIALIGQGGIINAARRGEWLYALAHGARYWVWRRGSNFHCPDCEENKGRLFPMDVAFSEMHARCLCYPEYHYEPIKL